jgi:hypothetical protein
MKMPPTSVAKTRNIFEITRANPTPQACADHEHEERERERESCLAMLELIGKTHIPTHVTLLLVHHLQATAHYAAIMIIPAVLHGLIMPSSQPQHLLQTARQHYKDSRSPCFFARQQRPFTKTTLLITARHTMQ